MAAANDASKEVLAKHLPRSRSDRNPSWTVVEVGRSRLMMLHGAVRNGRQIMMVYGQRPDHLICPGFHSSSRAVNSITHNPFAQAAFGEAADGGAGDVAQDLPRAVRGTARVERN